jgi:3'-(hydroxy)phthioceranyl-2'-palmitoyl(stearoyl)-2-O-sulfo-trehalose (hydroxy)phthioceranyltransferase
VVNKLLVGAVVAGFVSSSLVFGNGVAAADDVLILPSTGPPSGPASKLYHFKQQWVPLIGSKYYANPGVTGNPGTPGVSPKIITYPAVNPLSASGGMPVGESVAIGADNLDTAIKRNNGPMTVVGLSQGAGVLTEEQLRLQHDPDAPPPDQITFIKVSDPAIVLRRLFNPGTHLPIFNYTVPPPVESQYNTVNVVAQYDFVGDPPDHWWNLLAVLNSGMGRAHTMVAFSDPASVPPENITTTVNSRGGTVTTYRVPEQELPLTTALRNAGVPTPIVDALNPEMQRIVDAGYNRNNPNPFPNPNSGIQLPTLGNGLGGLGHVDAIAPAISIPIESTTAALSAASLATNGVSLISNAGNVVHLITTAASGVSAVTNPGSGVSAVSNAASAVHPAQRAAPNAGKGAKGMLSKLARMLPKGKNNK